MKNYIIIENYIQGLCSYLDENNIHFEIVDGACIKVYYTKLEELFRLGFEFGKWYANNE